MKKTVVAALIALSASIAAARSADACAMYRPPKPQPAAQVVASAEAEEKAGKQASAIRVYERVAMDPQAPAALRVKAARGAARLHDAAGRTDVAQIRLEQAIAIAPSDAALRLAMARVVILKDAAVAAEHLEKALAGALEDADRGVAEALLASALALQGRSGEAEPHLARAREMRAPAGLIAAAEAALRPTVAARM